VLVLQAQNTALHDELNARTAEQVRLAPIAETIWQLKVAAREIKRQWPTCMLVRSRSYFGCAYKEANIISVRRQKANRSNPAAPSQMVCSMNL
jgi:hypothetical protein